MHIRFDQRIALVTGAAQGIGQAIASTLKASGAEVVVADLDGERLKAFAASAQMEALVLDLSDRAAAHHAVEQVITRHGRLDILVNAAGGVRGQVGQKIADVTEENWRVLFQANVDGAFFMAQAASARCRRWASGGSSTLPLVRACAPASPAFRPIQQPNTPLLVSPSNSVRISAPWASPAMLSRRVLCVPTGNRKAMAGLWP